MFAVSLAQSSPSSWMIQKLSIQRYGFSRLRTNPMVSLKVWGNVLQGKFDWKASIVFLIVFNLWLASTVAQTRVSATGASFARNFMKSSPNWACPSMSNDIQQPVVGRTLIWRSDHETRRSDFVFHAIMPVYKVGFPSRASSHGKWSGSFCPLWPTAARWSLNPRVIWLYPAFNISKWLH